MMQDDDNDIFDDVEESVAFFPAAEERRRRTKSAEEGHEDVYGFLPLRDAVLFPGVMMPITAGRPSSALLLRTAMRKGKRFVAVKQVRAEEEAPATLDDLCRFGTLARVVKVLEMPDGLTTAIVEGECRVELTEVAERTPFLSGTAVARPDAVPTDDDQYQALLETLTETAVEVARQTGKHRHDFIVAIQGNVSKRLQINFIAANSRISADEKQRLLDIGALKDRGMALLALLQRENEFRRLKEEIRGKVRNDIDKQQREFFLNQQIKALQDELGDSPAQRETDELRQRAAGKKWPKEVAAAFEKEFAKLCRLSPMSPDYSVQSNYLQVMLDLPWQSYTRDKFDLAQARAVLDRDHYGIEKVKERVMEHLAVLKLKKDMKSPILCLYGPPGVGKTSLGKSIAAALGRKYVRMSLGGLHDEAEIRGHRKTYIGAMPGRIIQNVKKAGSGNPVFILDEIDKINRSAQGDPESALLEVLDPEQNAAFHDNFLELDYDLSKVMFVATANTLAGIHPALLDRMELIEVSGYLLEEKVEIALRHLIPKQLEAHGIKPGQLEIPRETLVYLIERYTRESGVRSLDKTLSNVARKVALKIATGEAFEPALTVDAAAALLGKPKFTPERRGEHDQAGVATGLAWTAAGGEILFVEAAVSKGSGALTLTGNLGDVMKESAMLALEYVKARGAEVGVAAEALEGRNVHVHVPEGAIPKDGPSAGVTMVSAVVSAFTGRKVRADVAMTGEITLRGKVLPVGGIKEKILAARRAGIGQIILSKENKNDVEEIAPEYIAGLRFHYVDTIAQVLGLALAEAGE